MRRPLSVFAFAAVLALALPTTAFADHPHIPAQENPAPNSTEAISGGGDWELIASFPGNDMTDSDIFTQNGKVYASAGTLAFGLFGGGTQIYELVDENGEVNPRIVSQVPTASCITDLSGALSLQHDQEATPKENAQLILGATDAPGRCHDQGLDFGLGVVGSAPKGGLELIDITDIENPAEIHLTRHIGEAHTVNVDPKRPHIIYAVSSDSVTIANRPMAGNENGSDNGDLDGFEMLDISSCMDFPAGTTIDEKRAACKPITYRYRFQPEWTQGTIFGGISGGCHELEVYEDNELLTCAAVQGSLVLDMAGAFDDNGTPDDYTDDTIKGTPLACADPQPTGTNPAWATGALVTDCVDGLDTSTWFKAGEPSVTGIELVALLKHAGREPTATSVNLPPEARPDVNISVSHEAHFTNSREYVLVTDERGGGVLAPGASCTPGATNPMGNGGIHAFRLDDIDPVTKEVPFAKDSNENHAVFRAPARVPASTFCTSHRMDRIPDENRLFVAWYSQGTQVVDYTENENGTIDFELKAWFVPEGSNAWVSDVFHIVDNDDGSRTYYGIMLHTLGSGATRGAEVFGVTIGDTNPTPVAPAPEPEPAPEPTPAPAPLPATGGGLAVTGLFALLAGAARRRR